MCSFGNPVLFARPVNLPICVRAICLRIEGVVGAVHQCVHGCALVAKDVTYASNHAVTQELMSFCLQMGEWRVLPHLSC